MAEFYTGNRYLSQAEMEVNATYIASYLHGRGWTQNAIAAILGNMQAESTINPGIWQSLNVGNTSAGYGLVQWTPATKYLDWCTEMSLDPSHMNAALMRIEWEIENGKQWYKTASYPLTFKQFIKSTMPPSYLAAAFMLNYERPANKVTTARERNAEAWYRFLTGVDYVGTGANPYKKKRLSLLLMILATKKR